MLYPCSALYEEHRAVNLDAIVVSQTVYLYSCSARYEAHRTNKSEVIDVSHTSRGHPICQRCVGHGSKSWNAKARAMWPVRGVALQDIDGLIAS